MPDTTPPPITERFSWTKFFTGLVDPTAYWKTLAVILRSALIIGILTLVVFGVLKLKSVFFPKKELPANFTQTGQTGGTVENVADHRTQKMGLINL
jgi:hypothetical protein